MHVREYVVISSKQYCSQLSNVCINTTNHAEVVRVHYDPNECTYETLLDLFWSRHDPTTLNRIYFYTPEQEKLARVKSGHAQSPAKSCKDPISCFG
ncbi:hypothetical protein BRARA_K01085 [Brassica rapa]|uniref:peptide-methionine (S)-S-oxide reductase n=1 Tax=Brassica campestris TaxID=3711 RepID=A0A397L1V1_BRACM|nr:hypothetical protein BRARA_K01085 [Brassica rapa]